MNLQKNISNTERFISIAAGLGLVAFGRRTSRSLPKSIGWALVSRGASGVCPVSALMGRDTASRHALSSASQTRRTLGGAGGVRVEVATMIDRPADEVYAYWRNLENLPLFMTHLKSVTEGSPRTSHWVAKGPLGTSVEWDADIIEDVPGELLSWKSVGEGDVVTAGSVRFAPVGRGTEVRVLLQYSPPGGRLGAVAAQLLGEDPESAIRQDLRRLKQVFEGREEVAPSRRRAARARMSAPYPLTQP
jgi:uncharacterized membrane protein